MSAIRAPRTATAHCPVAGCKWVRTYFDLRTTRKLGKMILTEIWPADVRAKLGERSHVARVHRTKTRINGR